MTLDITLDLLLDRIKSEADSLQAASPALDRIAAYQNAVASVIATTCETRNLSPFERQFLQAMLDLGGTALRMGRISNTLQLKGMDVDRWTLWDTARSLRSKCLIFQPGGDHGKTWTLTTAGREAAAVRVA